MRAAREKSADLEQVVEDAGVTVPPRSANASVHGARGSDL